MGISEAASHRGSSGDLCCPRCGKPILPQATFCGSCGERLDKKQALSSLLKDEQDIANHYRITSLVRRRPYVNLYFALDNQQARQGQQRMVAIRDIDITSLHDEAHTQAIELAQQEYDLLRHWRLPHVLPVVDLRYFHEHLFVVSGYPPIASSLDTTGKSENTKALTGKVHRLYTLQDFLQSGQGLPSEQQALKWIGYLCQALNGLHSHQTVIGELDPYTIILNENSNNAEPALMISWLFPQLQRLLRSSQATRFWSYFCAPEALQGKAEPRSDIYSLGAVLYLLLTGLPPGERVLRTKGRLRSPRELNGYISAHVNDCVMQALSIEPSKRFQNALEMSEALFNSVSATPTNDASIEAESMTAGEQFDKQEANAHQQTPLQDTHSQDETATTWFGQLQRLVLGQQQRAMRAAALIETPLRVQPNQVFTLRFHILGRDEPTVPPGTQEGDRSTWLSSLVQGERLSIEVRAVLNPKDTYVLQQATVVIPEAGYVTEVSIPIQPLSSVPSGRRDRLHIFFFDQQRHPLYDKPFVVEVFVSHFVKRGHEGHQVLTIHR